MVFHLKAPGVIGGDKKKARQYVDEIAQRDPVQGELAAARFEQEGGDSTRLEAHYRKAIEKDASSVEARLSLASWAAAPWRAQWAVVEEQARAVINLPPAHAGPYSLLAMAYARQSRWDDLDRVLADADQACPDNRSPWYTAGRTLVTDGRELPRAERCFRHFLEIEP